MSTLLNYVLLGIVLYFYFRLTITEGFDDSCAYQETKTCTRPVDPTDYNRGEYEACLNYNKRIQTLDRNCEKLDERIRSNPDRYKLKLTPDQELKCQEFKEACVNERDSKRDCAEELKMCLLEKREEIIRSRIKDEIGSPRQDVNNTKCNYKQTLSGPVYQKNTDEPDLMNYYDAPILNNPTINRTSIKHRNIQDKEYNIKKLAAIYDDTIAMHSKVREYADYEWRNVVGSAASESYNPCEERYIKFDGDSPSFDNNIVPDTGGVPCSDPSIPWLSPPSSFESRQYCGKSLAPCTYCGKFKGVDDADIYERDGYDRNLSGVNRRSNDMPIEYEDDICNMDISGKPEHERKFVERICKRKGQS
jgi:hypothetical protein